MLKFEHHYVSKSSQFVWVRTLVLKPHKVSKTTQHSVEVMTCLHSC